MTKTMRVLSLGVFLVVGLMGGVALAQNAPKDPKAAPPAQESNSRPPHLEFFPYFIDRETHRQLTEVLGEIPAKYSIPLINLLARKQLESWVAEEDRRKAAKK